MATKKLAKPEATGTGAAAGRYQKFEAARRPFLDRARQCAKLTIPMLMPEEGQNATSHYPKPFQALGARGVKNLASKLVNALFPPNTPFWRYILDSDAQSQLEKRPGVKSKMDSALSKIERIVQDYVESGMMRPKLVEVKMQLITAGNVLLHILPEGNLRVFRLDSYVVKRDAIGNVLEVLTKESVSPLTLAEDVKETCAVTERDIAEDAVKVYTHIKRTASNFVIYQEINGIPVPGSEGSYPLDACPWIALRFYAVDGEDYGRSYVEEHLGDLITHEALSQAITEGAVAAARIVFLVRPGSPTKVSVLEKTPNGGFAIGDAADVSAVQVQKYNDFRVALEHLNELSQRLAHAFLLNSAVQRQAERVTAEEIRFAARELEDVLGGIYSILSQELQLPMVRVVLKQMEKDGVMPALPKNVAKPVPITGMAALGRGNDFDRLRMFLGVVAETQMQGALNQAEVLERAATALGVDANGLVKSAEEMQAEQMNAFMAQAGQAAAPELIKGAMAPPQPPQ